MGEDDVGSAADSSRVGRPVTLIVPAAGQSSRFPGMRPKWSLTQPNGLPMVLDGLMGLDMTNVGRIVFVFLAEHVRKYGFSCEALINRAQQLFGRDVLVIKLVTPTRSQPETVAMAIETAQITGPIFVKDADNRFACLIPIGNTVAVHDISTMELAHVANKSFVDIDDNGLIQNIVEKRVIGPDFCVGGYSFSDAAEFVSTFESLVNDPALYVSHVIFKLMCAGHPFVKNIATDYVDWGTAKEWRDYREQFSTLFVDIDGVIVKNSGEFCMPLWGSTASLEKNVEYLNRLHVGGRAHIVLTTSRPESARAITLEQLRDLGVRYDQIVFGLPHTKRVIINDYTTTSPYRSCDAVNLLRDSDTLADMLVGVT